MKVPYEDKDGTMRLGQMTMLECITGSAPSDGLRFDSYQPAT